MPARLPDRHVPPATARKRAQRAVPMGPCERCGSKDDVQRHHPTLSSADGAVILLCKKCHVKQEQKEGGWGKFKDANLASLRAAVRRGTQRN